MRILELDVGNTSVSWRLLEAGDVTLHGRADHGGGGLPEVALDAIRMASVLKPAQTAELSEQLAARYDCIPWLAKVRERCAGLTLAYSDPTKLGPDRWLAMLGVRQQWQGAFVVVDIGTALTLDEVDADGQHLGGLILPGPVMMLNMLAERTAMLPRLTFEHPSSLPGTDTAGCMMGGVYLACLGLVDHYIRSVAQPDAQLYVTGGDTAVLLEALPQARWLPDAVLMGLAVAWSDLEHAPAS